MHLAVFVFTDVLVSFVFTDVLVSIRPCVRTLAMTLAVLEFSDVLGSIDICIGAETVMENA